MKIILCSSVVALTLLVWEASATLIYSSGLSGGISQRRGNGYFGPDTTYFAPGIFEAGSQRSANGQDDANNQRSSRTFVEFTLTPELIASAADPLAKVTFGFTLENVANRGGLYTDGLDLRYLGVHNAPLGQSALWNSAGIGGADQADIASTAAAAGYFTVELSNSQVRSQIGDGIIGNRVYFGLSNSAGVDLSAPVPISTNPHDRQLFLFNNSLNGFSLNIAVPEPSTAGLFLAGLVWLLRKRPK